MVFEQQKYERQQMARMQGQSVNGGSTWEGMYDDVPAPAGVNNRGGFAGRGGRGGGAPGGPRGPATPGNAPAGAPTGPKNAGMPGSNYRGGGRGGRGGGGGRFDPYARNSK
jgi:RNA-binding protein Musashi